MAETDSDPIQGSEGEGEATSPVKSGRGRHRRLFPGPGVCIVVLLLAAGGVYLAVTNALEDNAVTNAALIAIGMAIASTLFTWFVVFSGHPAPRRRRVLGAAALLGVAAVAVIRPVSTSGDLVMRFRFAWQPSGKETPKLEVFEAQKATLAVTSENDFPQFGGPNRSLKLDGGPFTTDWGATPPEALWRIPIGAGWSGFVAVNGYAVTMEQRDESELISCYEVESGKPVWTHATAARHDTFMGGLGPRSTPLIHDGRVYALGATGMFHCLDGATGEEVWSHDLLKDFGVAAGDDGKEVAWGRANSPLAVGGMVVIPAGGPQGGAVKSLAAYDAKTGELKWTGGEDQISYSSPTVMTLCGKRILLSVNEKTITGHDIATGSVLWELPWSGSTSGPANTSQPAQVDDTKLLISKGYNRGAAIIELAEDNGEWTAKFGWQTGRVLRTKLTSSIVHNGYAYGLNDGLLQCVDLKDGRSVWKADRLKHGQPLLVGDQLLVMAEWGDLHLYEAKPGDQKRVEPVAIFKDALTGTAWNMLCLYGDRLLVRSNKEAACYKLPSK